MTKQYTSILIAAMISAINATGQTLNNANTSPVPGDVFLVNSSAYTAEGPPGAGQIWDHSDLTSQSSSTLTMVTPASTGFAASFPGATAAQGQGQPGSFGFLKASATGLESLGARSAASSLTMFYSNSQIQLPYPCSYNTTWTDEYSSTYTSNGSPGTRTGTITGEADGYGTLIMPYGTVANVLRVRIMESQLDDFPGLYQVEYSSDHFIYFKPGFHNPLLGIYSITTVLFGAPTTTQYVTWLDGSAVSVDELSSKSIGIDVFPVPARDMISVSFGTEGGQLRVDVLDAQGKLVREESVTASIGIDIHTMDIGNLDAGLYHLRVTTKSGQQGVRRFVVE